jgi:protein-S-isoprenylcysteine O-methyltransferase Ste14
MIVQELCRPVGSVVLAGYPAIVSAARPMDIEHGAPEEGVKQVVEVARSALDEEFQRAERYDAKARGQMMLAGSWFAVVQAVAAVSLRGDTPNAWALAIAAAAVLAGLVLIWAMRQSARVWKLRSQPAINQETLEDMLSSAEQDPERFGHELVLLYRNLLGNAQDVNAKRASAFEDATGAWWWALALAFAELAIALASRVFGV